MSRGEVVVHIVSLLMWCVCVVRCARLHGVCLISESALGSGEASVCTMLCLGWRRVICGNGCANAFGEVVWTMRAHV